MRRDPLPPNTGLTKVTPPVDMADSNAVYQYTDDLCCIHQQLTMLFQIQQKLSSRDLILCARVQQSFREYFDGGQLECWNEAKASEEAEQFIIHAHTRVITLFHSLWGVLPSRELDDYRVLDVSPYSLSEDFVEEALFGIRAASKGDNDVYGLSRSDTSIHESKAQFTYPVWVGPIELLYKKFEGRVGSQDDEGNISLDCLGPFKGGINAMHMGGWTIGDVAYINAEILDISGIDPNVVGYTADEISDLCAKGNT